MYYFTLTRKQFKFSQYSSHGWKGAPLFEILDVPDEDESLPQALSACHVFVIIIKLVLLGLIVKRRVTFFVKPHGKHTHTHKHTLPPTDTHTHTDTHSHTQKGTHKKVIRI